MRIEKYSWSYVMLNEPKHIDSTREFMKILYTIITITLKKEKWQN